MDNCVAYLETKLEVQELQRSATEIMERAKMNLRGWEYSFDDNPSKEPLTKTLGVVWNKRECILKCEFPKNVSLPSRLTKRLVLLANSIHAALKRKCEIEHLINNRPLTYVSEDGNDLKPLTPNEFLQNGPEPSFPVLENLKPEMLHAKYRKLGQLKKELKQRSFPGCARQCDLNIVLLWPTLIATDNGIQAHFNALSSEVLILFASVQLLITSAIILHRQVYRQCRGAALIITLILRSVRPQRPDIAAVVPLLSRAFATCGLKTSGQILKPWCRSDHCLEPSQRAASKTSGQILKPWKQAYPVYVHKSNLIITSPVCVLLSQPFLQEETKDTREWLSGIFGIGRLGKSEEEVVYGLVFILAVGASWVFFRYRCKVCLNHSKKWVAAFKLGRISTEDEHRPGRPVEFVTMDETWAHHFTPESKQQSMQWRHSGSPPPKKAKTVPSSGKQLREAIKEKRRGKLSRKIVYHQGNAPSHRSLQAMAAIYDSGFELLPNAPYSPDLAPRTSIIRSPTGQKQKKSNYPKIRIENVLNKRLKSLGTKIKIRIENVLNKRLKSLGTKIKIRIENVLNKRLKSLGTKINIRIEDVLNKRLKSIGTKINIRIEDVLNKRLNSLGTKINIRIEDVLNKRLKRLGTKINIRIEDVLNKRLKRLGTKINIRIEDVLNKRLKSLGTKMNIRIEDVLNKRLKRLGTKINIRIEDVLNKRLKRLGTKINIRIEDVLNKRLKSLGTKIKIRIENVLNKRLKSLGTKINIRIEDVLKKKLKSLGTKINIRIEDALNKRLKRLGTKINIRIEDVLNKRLKRFHRRVKSKNFLQDHDVPIDDTTIKPLFTSQEKGRKATRDRRPRLQGNT
ncbi:hypothetical protein LAZ67_17000819 [Cordylochernes scorpioides]|uniref:Uncharacterized protein n=1 Tax=Cordylochernes scorpioides TaxID=51811 RepID=A0ABY6LFQ1_9ARAC|nr:hypothetical protein LAZ67_17000819 [Cordylochernes scorpioides]